MMYEGSVSVPELRALAFKHFMEHKALCINDGELIAVSYTHLDVYKRQACCCHCWLAAVYLP